MSREYTLYFNYKGTRKRTTIRANYNIRRELDRLKENGQTFTYRGEEISFKEVVLVT